VEGKGVVGKGAPATGITAALRGLSSKIRSGIWGASQGVN